MITAYLALTLLTGSPDVLPLRKPAAVTVQTTHLRLYAFSVDLGSGVARTIYRGVEPKSGKWTDYLTVVDTDASGSRVDKSTGEKSTCSVTLPQLLASIGSVKSKDKSLTLYSGVTAAVFSACVDPP